MLHRQITTMLATAALIGAGLTGCSGETESSGFEDTTATGTSQQKPTSGSTEAMSSQRGSMDARHQADATEARQGTEAMRERASTERQQQPMQRSQEGSLSEYRGQEPLGTIRAEATFYGEDFAGQRTASGDVYDPSAMTAANERYPLGTIIRVVNPDNQQSVIVRINDRLSTQNEDGSDIDLSRAAAERIGITEEGRAQVRVELLELANR